MPLASTTTISPAPPRWRTPCTHTEARLHQLSPYIGKLKSSIAGDLIDAYTKAGDLVVDPFCGSGTIPLECVLRGRRAIASDSSTYATILTMAKLQPPSSVALALRRLDSRLEGAAVRPRPDLRRVPRWVRVFFHPETLIDAIRFADECLAARDYFLLACFLGILHHQRPGFLSFPSSHLVPYLRERNFPRRHFPELYERRDIRSRMIKKIQRALSNTKAAKPALNAANAVRAKAIQELHVPATIDAVLTSPPYMNALDYRRDNRLRMWFLDRETSDYSPESTDKRAQFKSMIDSLCKRVTSRLRVGGYCVLIIGETVRRKRMTSHPAGVANDLIGTLAPELQLEAVIQDHIPDVRRARRGHAAAKTELVLIYRKVRSAGLFLPALHAGRAARSSRSSRGRRQTPG
jgi:hypothetical protein